MIKKRFSKAVIAGILSVFMVTALASCSGGSPKENKIVFNINGEEKTIDPTLNESSYAGTLIINSFEGLTRLDKDNKPKPGVAEKWVMSPDGKEYTFYLRQGSKWSDGKEVTAKDFEFSWKRGLKKETASPYAEYLMYIKGGKDYFEGKAKDVEGIKVVDEHTLRVTLENPVAFFLELTAFSTYMPLREDIVKDDKWAVKPETYISNGPMTLKVWKPKDIMVYERNENYWNKDVVKLDKLEVKMIEEQTNALSAFKTGEIDYMEKPPAQEIPGLLKDGIAFKQQLLGTYMYQFNISDKMKQKDPKAYEAINNPKVRTALSLAINRKDIVENASKGGEIPANSITPPGITDSTGKDFKSKEYFPVEGNVAEAKKLLAEAGYPEGKNFPEIEVMYNTGAGHEQVAQAVQEMWRKNLGINLKLANQEWKVYIDRQNKKDFTVSRKGWIGDYSDPSTFLKLFQTGAGNNDTGYSNKAFDALLKTAEAELDEAKRIDLYHKAEEILNADMPAIPIYYYTNIICLNKDVKGVTTSSLGHTTFFTGSKGSK